MKLNCNLSKNSSLSHKEWIQYQFDCRDKKEQYRDILIHVSLVESILINESERYHSFPCPNEKGNYRNFRYAISLLKGIYKNKKDNKEFGKIENLWKCRCELIHGIIKNGLSELEIKNLIKKIYKNIKIVYKSGLFNKIFKNIDVHKKRGYNFLPSKKLSSF